MMQLQFPLLCRHRTPLLWYNVSHLSSFCHKTSLLCYNVNCLLSDCVVI